MKTAFLVYWLSPVMLITLVMLLAKPWRKLKAITVIMLSAYGLLTVPYLVTARNVPPSLSAVLSADKDFEAKTVYVVSMTAARAELVIEYQDSIRDSTFVSREWYEREAAGWKYMDGRPVDESWEWLFPPRWIGSCWWDSL
jgi:hypothetical protein